jgi:hypothetical protein
MQSNQTRRRQLTACRPPVCATRAIDVWEAGAIAADRSTRFTGDIPRSDSIRTNQVKSEQIGSLNDIIQSNCTYYPRVGRLNDFRRRSAPATQAAGVHILIPAFPWWAASIALRAQRLPSSFKPRRPHLRLPSLQERMSGRVSPTMKKSPS